MSIVETARKQLEEKSIAEVAYASSLQGRTIRGTGIGKVINRQASPELRMAKKDQVAPAPSPQPSFPGAQQPPQQPQAVQLDATQTQNWVNSLSPESLKVLSDIVKTKMEAKQTPVQTPPAPQNPVQKGPF